MLGRNGRWEGRKDAIHLQGAVMPKFCQAIESRKFAGKRDVCCLPKVSPINYQCSLHSCSGTYFFTSMSSVIFISGQ